MTNLCDKKYLVTYAYSRSSLGFYPLMVFKQIDKPALAFSTDFSVQTCSLDMGQL